MILLLDLMGLAAGEREGMGEEAFRGNCKIMVVHYVTKGESQKNIYAKKLTLHKRSEFCLDTRCK